MQCRQCGSTRFGLGIGVRNTIDAQCGQCGHYGDVTASFGASQDQVARARRVLARGDKTRWLSASRLQEVGA